MKKLLLIAIFIIGLGITGYAQTDCEQQLTIQSQRLVKTLDALNAAESAINAQKAEIDALRALDGVNQQLLAKKNEIIQSQDELIKKLEKSQRPQIRFFWGAFRITF